MSLLEKLIWLWTMAYQVHLFPLTKGVGHFAPSENTLYQNLKVWVKRAQFSFPCVAFYHLKNFKRGLYVSM